ncbi:lipid-A-disaccharide synthase N-terminal domain-containing protein [Fulvivirgaceae bacterium BMA12]|uniref:Lipid-A-disaccharide synthase N-terminal domain-containing protein n=1 Tax=Agaribacillus aureus TaxID=3051825 RepID=A0ABT8LAZ6_9BACT|nr:lipid-A-disaccharide synthase N-terminal domain-containing protein [Fulvivirgaceae bacterium BMA12]
MNNLIVYLVGFSAQMLFAARLLIQWVKSERAGHIVSPILFWQFSLAASSLMIIYGILRKDPVILLGQALTYYIYIRNLQFKNTWYLIPLYFRFLVLIFPILAISWLFLAGTHNLHQIITNKAITNVMMALGSMGQIVFGFRFVYQWYYSEKLKVSKLPLGFWLFSIAGSLIILTYAIYRHDPVLLVGQLFGLIIYIRNSYLDFKPALLTGNK